MPGDYLRDTLQVFGPPPDGALTELNKHVEKISERLSPGNFINEKMEESMRDMMQSNGPQIVLGLVAAAAYSAAFHHIKDFAKRRTEKHRRVGGAVRYVADVMLPTGFFGPVLGMLLRAWSGA